MTRYKHTQIGHTIIWGVLAMAAFAAITGIFSQRGLGAALIAEVILLICAVFFSKLTVQIENGSLQWSFGIGLIQKQVLIFEIAACEAIQIPWWYGWGIHLTPYGWLYNVSGLHAVAITLRNGRKFALGTDDPQGLADAIERSSHASG